MLSRCLRCPCTKGRSPVPYHGPTPCRILFIGECPASTEDKYGIPLIGQTGEEFNDQYLACAALFRANVGVINAMLCSQPSYRNPKPHEAFSCSTLHLPALLSRLQPQIIIPMGAIACSLFPSLSLILHHGIPQWGEGFGWSGILFPTFHPSSGLHSTAYMIPLRRDFTALGSLVKQLDQGTFSWPTDPYPTPDYSVIRSTREIEDYILGDNYESYITSTPFSLDLATDTETLPDGSPYCLTITRLDRPGTGRLIYTHDTALIKFYADTIRLTNPLLHFHAYLADDSKYAAMSLPIPRYSDTLVRAYNMGLGGGGDDEDEGGSGAARGLLGLKTLAYRHLHMSMTSFRDTVLPHTIPHVIDWLKKGALLTSPGEPVKLCVCGHGRECHEERGKTRRRTGGCRAGVGLGESGAGDPCQCERYREGKGKRVKGEAEGRRLNRKVLGLIKTLREGGWKEREGKKAVDPWKRVMGGERGKDGWHGWEKEVLVEGLGEMPVMDVRLVPEGEFVGYACRDSDATARLARFLDRYRVW